MFENWGGVGSNLCVDTTKDFYHKNVMPLEVSSACFSIPRRFNPSWESLLIWLTPECDGIGINVMMYWIMNEKVDVMLRNMLWDMMMNGMMDWLIDLMMSLACICCLVHHRLQLLVDGRCWSSVQDLVPPPSDSEYIRPGVWCMRRAYSVWSGLYTRGLYCSIEGWKVDMIRGVSQGFLWQEAA